MPTPERTGLTWRKSSYSTVEGANCVEIAATETSAAVRDSKAPDSGLLNFAPAAWRAFLAWPTRH